MHILLVDDEEIQRSMLEGFLQKQGYCVQATASAQEALNYCEQHPIELVLLDYRMPDMQGDELLALLKEQNPMIRAIMITAYGSVDTAVRVMQLGAEDFIEKPIDLQDLLNKIQTIQEQLFISQDADKVVQKIRTEDLPVRMVASSPAMQEVLSLLLRAAPTPWTILLKGETGTGKELAARLTHLLSSQKNGPFVELNCAAIPENLFESELFGHEAGAFTGAVGRRKGLFEQADGGTLFLDEAGELPLSMQAKLLRAVQNQNITRVGGERTISIHTRIIAATNRNLQEMVEQGQFREDLYFRLNAITIDIPPLRERKEELRDLIEFFLKKFNSEVRFDDRALNKLSRYHFPGNIRELEHIIQRLITFTRTPVITHADLPPEIQPNDMYPSGGNLNDQLAQIERTLITRALEQHEWIQTRAAESLGISERVLRYKMEKAGLSKKSRG